MSVELHIQQINDTGDIKNRYENFKKKLPQERISRNIILGTATLPQPLQALTTEAFAAAPKRAKRIVLISLDGICVAGFKQAKTPHLDALLAEGVLSTKTRVVMPSVTLPNWTSHLTGSGPEQHGVTNNAWTVSKHKLPAIEKIMKDIIPPYFLY